MNPIEIIENYYPIDRDVYKILVAHSRDVATKALQIASMHPEMNLDLQFVEEAAMLHDIGIIYTNAPDLDCHGERPYICHGYLGHDLLMKEGFPKHALVCERHTGTGLSLQHIIDSKLPIPHRDMMPLSLEEQLICFADKFYSKTKLGQEKTQDQIEKSLLRHGEETAARFAAWRKLFLGE